MEDEHMDKAWNTFEATGKIDDYLIFCEERKEREEQSDGNKPSSDRDGVKCHAHW